MSGGLEGTIVRCTAVTQCQSLQAMLAILLVLMLSQTKASILNYSLEATNDEELQQ